MTITLNCNLSKLSSRSLYNKLHSRYDLITPSQLTGLNSFVKSFDVFTKIKNNLREII